MYIYFTLVIVCLHTPFKCHRQRTEQSRANVGLQYDTIITVLHSKLPARRDTSV